MKLEILQSKKGLIIAGLIFFILLTIIYMTNHRLLLNIKEQVVTKLEEELELGIELDSIRLSGFNQLVMEEFQLAGPTAPPLVTAEKLVIEYKWLDLLFNSLQPVKSISRIEVTAPEVNVSRGKDGNYSFLQGLAAGEEGKAEGLFTGEIAIEAGQINYSSPEISETITGIEGTVGVGSRIDFALAAQLPVLIPAEFKLQGQLTGEEYQGQISFSRLDLTKIKSDWKAKVINLDSVDYQGLLAGKIKLSGNFGSQPTYYGDLKLTEGQIDYQELQLNNLTAELGVNNYGLKVKEASANYQESLITVSGEVFNWQQPQLNLNYQVEEFALQELKSYLPDEVQLAGKAGINGKIRGAARKPNVVGDIKLDQGRINQEAVSDFSARLHYKGEVINLKQAAFTYQEGRIKGEGTINLAEQLQYMLSLDFNQLELAKLNENLDYNFELAGLASGEGVISGQGLDKKKLNVLGSVSVVQGNIAGYPVDEFTSNFWINKGKVFLNQAKLLADQGVWNLEGIVDLGGELDLTLEAAEVKLSNLRSLHQLNKLTGSINLQGELKGKLKNPEFRGGFALAQLGYDQFRIGQAQGDINYQAGAVELKQVKLPQLNTEIRGAVDFKDQTSHIKAATEAVKVEKILTRGNLDWPASGVLTAALEVTNVLTEPSIAGTAAVTDGSIYHQPVDQVELNVGYQDQKLQINKLTGKYKKSSFQAAGEYEAERLNLEFSTQQLRLQDIQATEELGVVKGTAAIDGRLYGELTDLKLAAETKAQKLQIDNYKLGMLTATMQYEKPNLHCKQGRLKKEGFEYKFSGGLNLDQKKFKQLRVDVLKGNLVYLDQFLEEDLRLVHPVQGRVIANGSFLQPRLELDLDIDDIDETGYLELQGSYWHQKGMDLKVAARQFKVAPLTNLKSLLDLDISLPHLAGEMDLSGRLHGELNNLNVDSNLQINQGEINNFDYQKLSGRLKVIEGDRLFLQQTLQDKGGEILRTNGVVPLKQEQEFDLAVKLRGGNLNLLSLAVADLKSIHGRGQADLKIEGTWADINLQGQAELEGAGFTHPAFDREVKELTGEFNFTRDKIIVDNLRGKYGQGIVEAEGDISLTGLLPASYDLQVEGTDVAFNHGSWQGLNDVQLEIKGGFYDPLIKGQITAHDTMFELPAKWPTPDEELPIKPRFDLVIKPRQNVKVGNENIDILVQDGELELATTEQEQIELTGSLSSTTGRFTYYNTEFELVEGTAQFTKYSFVPQLDIRARTSLPDETGEVKEIYLDVQGSGEDIAADPWQLNFSSEPAMTRREIINLLSQQGGIGSLLEKDYDQAVKNELRRLIGQGLKTELIYKIERSFERSLNLDQVQIRSLLQNELEIKIGKYIFDGFMLKMTKTFGQEERYSYGFEYRFSEGIDNLRLNGNYDKQGDYKLGMELTLPF